MLTHVLTSKLYRMHKNKSFTWFWVIRSRVEVYLGAKGENRNFARKLWFFFSLMSHVSHIKRAPEKQSPTPNLTLSKIKTMRFWVFPEIFFFKLALFSTLFCDLFFDREKQFKNYFLHYKPCTLTSLKSRKIWVIFAFTLEKIDFLG